MADENIMNESSKSTNNCESTADVRMDMFSDTWGFSIEDLYKIAVTFYRGLYILFRILKCGRLFFTKCLYTRPAV